MSGATGERLSVMREWSATVGATDGNIIAAIITIQTPANHASVPRSVHGPPSMSCISSAVHSHPTAARPKRRATSPSRTRAAANAGARPLLPAACSCVDAINGSGGPREGCRQPRLPFVLDAEGADLRPRGLGSGQLRAGGVEHARQTRRLPGLDAERHDVLDLEVDPASDP